MKQYVVTKLTNIQPKCKHNWHLLYGKGTAYGEYFFVCDKCLGGKSVKDNPTKTPPQDEK